MMSMYGWNVACAGKSFLVLMPMVNYKQGYTQYSRLIVTYVEHLALSLACRPLGLPGHLEPVYLNGMQCLCLSAGGVQLVEWMFNPWIQLSAICCHWHKPSLRCALELAALFQVICLGPPYFVAKGSCQATMSAATQLWQLLRSNAWSQACR